MEPRKITGQTVDPGDGSPLIDVDTAVLALHEQLGREGARRAQNALGVLINFASKASADAAAPWHVFEDTLAGPMQREIARYDYAGRSIHLAPEEDLDEGNTTITAAEIFAEAENIRREREEGGDGSPST